MAKINKAKKAAKEIMRDLSDRKGVIDSIDDEILDDIQDSIQEIIEKFFGEN